jgi:hypothetical protein
MKITASNYKKDKLYVPVARAVAEILKKESVVTPVDVIMRMDRLAKENYEDWRFGRIPYLEKVFVGNLSKANRILLILRYHAQALHLTPSQTEYRKWGKGGKRIVLRFSKGGHPRIEAAYSCHYVAARKRKRLQVSQSPRTRASAEVTKPKS